MNQLWKCVKYVGKSIKRFVFIIRVKFDTTMLKIVDFKLWPYVLLNNFRTVHPIRILFGVHGYYPDIGGCEFQVQWMAEWLKDKGYECYVFAPRELGQPRRVNGVPVVVSSWVARYCDVVFTYSHRPHQQKLGDYLLSLKRRPRWMHFPCSGANRGLDLIKHADGIIAKTYRDIELTQQVCGNTQNVIKVVHASHSSRRGNPNKFSEKYNISEDYILWVGAWFPAKGVKNLCERFLEFKKRHPVIGLKLVMFGGYGSGEYPLKHKDILRTDKNSEDVPDAIRDCLFIAFNSPAHPMGYDANPAIFFEGFMNRKTFVAQGGTPILRDIGHLGLVVETDDEWLSAVETLIFDKKKRHSLEDACYRAYKEIYNFSNMMNDIEGAIKAVLIKQPVNKKVT